MTRQDTLQELHHLVQAYLSQSLESETPVVDYRTPQELHGAMDLSLPEVGRGQASMMRAVADYLQFSVRTSSPRYCNQLWSGFSLPGFVGEVAAALSNTSMATYEIAPVATLIEQALIQRLGQLVGFESCEGLFVTGGSNANMVAMMAARHRVAPELHRKGSDGRCLQMFVSDQAHYSFAKAAHVMGLGLDNVIKVASDADGRMDVEALRQAITSSRRAGAQPFFVAATAGTTVLGAFDPLKAIAEICAEEELWFHIDGAWGGSVAVSERLRPLIDGSHHADSFTWDQHKMLGLPLVCSTILLRQPGMLSAMNDVGGSEYIFHDALDDVPNLGPISLQCGRKVDALKLWLAWTCFGRVGLAQRVEHLFDLTQSFAERLDRHARFERVASVASLNVCFRYNPSAQMAANDIDRLNLQARESLAKSGAALVNYAQVGGRPCWRLVISNFDLTSQDMDRLFTDIEAACEAAFAGVPLPAPAESSVVRALA